MSNSINIAEILIVNCTGIICLLFLIGSRYMNKATKRVGEYLFNSMIWINILLLSVETLTFLIDGISGKFINILLYLSNAVAIFSTTLMGYMWVLFVEFKVHHSLKSVRKLAIIFGIPIVINFVLVFLDCFGAELIFSISDNNVYSRENFSWIEYVFLAFYFVYSIMVVYVAKHKGTQIHFFPVYTFVLPCILGTIVQALMYGVATGWFSVAIALLFVEIQLQKEESFVDELSGLYNRKYLEFFYNQMRIKNYNEVYGIMMDLNRFKKINDTYGHTVGDEAIRIVSKLLSQCIENPDTVMRFAGDEFIVICVNKTEKEVVEVMDGINKHVSEFNSVGKKPYELSLSMGYTKYTENYTNLDEFLRDMDMKMYAAKEEFHRTHKA